MVDVVDKATRSSMMSNIRGKNTAPEILVRRAMHRKGFRYKLHDKTLPGKPDLIFPKYKAVININGCFWHKHNCHLFKWPSTRKEFWKEKILSTVERDKRNTKKLQLLGWRVLTVWECSLKGKHRLDEDMLLAEIVEWLLSDQSYSELTSVIT